MFGKIVTLAILTLAVMQVNGLHFYIQEGKEKCLMDDIPQGTVIYFLISIKIYLNFHI